MKYWKATEDESRLSELSLPVKLGGRYYIHPTAEQAAVFGAYPRQEPPEGAEVVKWRLVDGRWEATFTPGARIFSKLKIVAALRAAGVWEETRRLVEEAGLYDYFLAAQDFREDNPYFTRGKAQLMTSLDWTEEQAEALLSQCIKEEY